MENIQPIAKFSGTRGKNYREILDLLKQGKVLISAETYIGNKKEIFKTFREYLPTVAGIHCSYAPLGVSFSDANKKYGKHYEGYHVSEDAFTGEKILFPLAKKLLGKNGIEVDVFSAVDHIILVRLDSVDGKPAIEYEYSAKGKETRLYLNADQSIVRAPVNYHYVELKGGVFTESKSSNPKAYSIWRSKEENWNGIAILGWCDPMSFQDDVFLINQQPSKRVGVLAKA